MEVAISRAAGNFYKHGCALMKRELSEGSSEVGGETGEFEIFIFPVVLLTPNDFVGVREAGEGGGESRRI